jgi:hypothetical protein
MENVGIFYGHLQIFYGHVVYFIAVLYVYFVVIYYMFSFLGMLYQEKSGSTFSQDAIEILFKSPPTI